MMKRTSTALSLGCLAMLAAAPAACTDDDARTGESSSPLENAPEDPHHQFSVGVCGGPLTGGTSGTCTRSRCTGTLIAPNLVLTARHCVNSPTVDDPTSLCTNTEDNFYDPGTVKQPSEMHVTTSPSAIEGSPVWYDVREIAQPAGTNLCHDDIALLHLTANIPAAEAEPIAPDVYTDLAAYRPGEITIVGRGAIVTTWDPVTGERLLFDNGGLRRRILQHIPVLCTSNTDGECGVLFDYTILQPPRSFELTAGVILIGGASHPGDSGAGYLHQERFDFGRPSLIGVNSYGGVDSNGIEYAGFGVRIDYHTSFLVESAVRAAQAGGFPVPDWVEFPGTPCGAVYCEAGYRCCNSCPPGMCARKGDGCPTDICAP